MAFDLFKSIKSIISSIFNKSSSQQSSTTKSTSSTSSSYTSSSTTSSTSSSSFVTQAKNYFSTPYQISKAIESKSSGGGGGGGSTGGGSKGSKSVTQTSKPQPTEQPQQQTTTNKVANFFKETGSKVSNFLGEMFGPKQAINAIKWYALEREKHLLEKQEQERAKKIEEYEAFVNEKIQAGQAWVVPIMATRTPESGATYQKEVREYNQLFQSGLQAGLIKEANGQYVFNISPESKADLEFIQRLEKEYKDIEEIDKQSKWTIQRNVVTSFNPWLLKELNEKYSQIPELKMDRIETISKAQEAVKPFLMVDIRGSWLAGKNRGILGGKAIDFIQNQIAKIPEKSTLPEKVLKSEFYQKTTEKYGNSPEQAGRFVYGATRRAVEFIGTYPAETVALYGLGKFALAPAFSGVQYFEASAVMKYPAVVAIEQTAVTGSIGAGLTITGIQLYKDVKSPWQMGEYEQAGKKFTNVVLPLGLTWAGASAGKGHGLSKYFEQKTQVQLQDNIFKQYKMVYETTRNLEEQANLLNQFQRKYTISLWERVTGRTPKIYYTVKEGEFAKLMVKSREPLFPEFKQIIYREGERVVKVKITRGNIQETAPEEFILKAELAKGKLWESMKPIQKESYLQKETAGRIDLTRVEGWDTLPEKSQERILKELAPKDIWTRLGFKKTEVFGSTSTGKPSAGDIDIFTTTSGSRFAKALPKSIEIVQLTGRGAGSSVVMGSGIKFDIHPYSEKFSFPFWKEAVKTEQGIMKTQTGEEISRRMFGAFQSSERFDKDVMEFIRIAKLKGADVSAVERGFQLVKAEQISYQLAKPTPAMSAIVASIAAQPSFVLSKPSIPKSSQFSKPSFPSKSSIIKSMSISVPKYVSKPPSFSKSFSYYSKSAYYYSPSYSKSPSLSYYHSYSPSISPYYSPYYSPSITPSFEMPWFPLPKFSIGFPSKFQPEEKYTQPFKYQPSFGAMVLGIKGRPIKTLTGLEFRPIPTYRKRRK